MKRFFDKFYKQFVHKAQKKIVFADEKSIGIGADESVDVILSPKYYWVKSEQLPLKYTFQAKEYAPSLFEGMIPEGDYSYLAVKQGAGKFLLFAYDVKNILDSLETLGLKLSQINNIYFAQIEFINQKAALKIDDSYALIVRNAKVIKVPLALAEEHIDINNLLSFHSVSKNKIKLSRFNKFYETKGSFAIVYVLLFLIALFAAQIFYLNSIEREYEARKDEIIKQYSLPSTEIQLKAVLKQYDKINADQELLRKKLGVIFKSPFASDESFFSLKAESGKVSLVLNLNAPSRAGQFRSYYEKEFIIESFKENGSNIQIEMRYE